MEQEIITPSEIQAASDLFDSFKELVSCYACGNTHRLLASSKKEFKCVCFARTGSGYCGAITYADEFLIRIGNVVRERKVNVSNVNVTASLINTAVSVAERKPKSNYCRTRAEQENALTEISWRDHNLHTSSNDLLNQDMPLADVPFNTESSFAGKQSIDHPPAQAASPNEPSQKPPAPSGTAKKKNWRSLIKKNQNPRPESDGTQQPSKKPKVDEPQRSLKNPSDVSRPPIEPNGYSHGGIPLYQAPEPAKSEKRKHLESNESPPKDELKTDLKGNDSVNSTESAKQQLEPSHASDDSSAIASEQGVPRADNKPKKAKAAKLSQPWGLNALKRREPPKSIVAKPPHDDDTKTGKQPLENEAEMPLISQMANGQDEPEPSGLGSLENWEEIPNRKRELMNNEFIDSVLKTKGMDFDAVLAIESGLFDNDDALPTTEEEEDDDMSSQVSDRVNITWSTKQDQPPINAAAESPTDTEAAYPGHHSQNSPFFDAPSFDVDNDSVDIRNQDEAIRPAKDSDDPEVSNFGNALERGQSVEDHNNEAQRMYIPSREVEVPEITRPARRTVSLSDSEISSDSLASPKHSTVDNATNHAYFESTESRIVPDSAPSVEEAIVQDQPDGGTLNVKDPQAFQQNQNFIESQGDKLCEYRADNSRLFEEVLSLRRKFDQIREIAQKSDTLIPVAAVNHILGDPHPTNSSQLSRRASIDSSASIELPAAQKATHPPNKETTTSDHARSDHSSAKPRPKHGNKKLSNKKAVLSELEMSEKELRRQLYEQARACVVPPRLPDQVNPFEIVIDEEQCAKRASKIRRKMSVAIAKATRGPSQASEISKEISSVISFPSIPQFKIRKLSADQRPSAVVRRRPRIDDSEQFTDYETDQRELASDAESGQLDDFIDEDPLDMVNEIRPDVIDDNDAEVASGDHEIGSNSADQGWEPIDKGLSLDRIPLLQKEGLPMLCVYVSGMEAKGFTLIRVVLRQVGLTKVAHMSWREHNILELILDPSEEDALEETLGLANLSIIKDYDPLAVAMKSYDSRAKLYLYQSKLLRNIESVRNSNEIKKDECIQVLQWMLDRARIAINGLTIKV